MYIYDTYCVLCEHLTPVSEASDTGLATLSNLCGFGGLAAILAY